MNVAILTRHAESEYSARDLLNGDPAVAVPLTERGRVEARALGEWLRNRPVDLSVTSRFLRTKETSALALAGREVPTLALADLDDVRVGELEGRDVHRLRVWQRANGVDVSIPGGESRIEAMRRFVSAYRTLLGRQERSILVVTHGLPVTAVLLALRGEAVPVTLERVQVRPAEPHLVSAEDLALAVDRLDEWISEKAAR